MAESILLGSSTIEEKILQSCRSVVAAFFPGSRIRIGIPEQDSPNNTAVLRIEKVAGAAPFVFETVYASGGRVSETRRIGFEGELSAYLPGKEPFSQLVVKRALFLFLAALTGIENPWGILTGMRPGKLLNIMRQLDLKREIQDEILQNYYLLAPSKISLLRRVQEVQEPYLQAFCETSRKAALYLTIPFCPSRCFYCSFPAHFPASKNQELIPGYLQALSQEIRLTAEMLQEKGIALDSVYIGGGTPTVLDPSQLAALLETIESCFRPARGIEYTVEGGRPETLSLEKLNILKHYGVNRLCINPQSMQEKTLRAIGRCHGIRDIIDSYTLARQIAGWSINMDLIIGLPEESAPEIFDSVQKILQLKPDNITIHALSLKRGSSAWEINYSHNTGRDWVKLTGDIDRELSAVGYHPYYLYRQKNIVGNLENIGFSLPGKECRYNIAIIEEKQNVIGLGAGAVSKIFQTVSRHENIYNAKDPVTYGRNILQVHARRKALL